MELLTMQHNAVYSAIANPNGFEKAKVRWQKYFKIMVKLAETILRSTELSIAYSPCYSIVLMCYNVMYQQYVYPTKTVGYTQ